MSTLKKLNELADANFGTRPFLSARSFGFLIAAYAFLSFARAFALMFGPRAGGQDTTTIGYLLIGTTLPQLFAFAGGLRLLRGDLQGKRPVVYAIALGLIYAINALLHRPVEPCGDGMAICAGIWHIALILYVIPAVCGVALLLYFAVGLMGYGKSPRAFDRFASATVTVIGCLGLLLYARVVPA